jgi:hypothetical protein
MDLFASVAPLLGSEQKPRGVTWFAPNVGIVTNFLSCAALPANTIPNLDPKRHEKTS